MTSWIARLRDNALHGTAWLLLRTCSPARAHGILIRIGAHFTPLKTPDEARRAWVDVARRGTCLSRALAVAARAPSADVVIGVEPRKDAPLFAHAWIEMNGTPIDPSDVAGTVIARLHGPHSSRRRP